MIIKNGIRFKSYTIRLIVNVAALLVFLLLLLSILLIFMFRRNLDRDIENYSAEKLRFARDSVDAQYFSATEKTCITILGSHVLNPVMDIFTPGGGSAVQIIDAYEALKAQQLKLVDFAESVNLYDGESELILSTTTGANFLNNRARKGWIRDENWIRAQRENGRGQNGWTDVRSVRSVNSLDEQLRVFTYVQYPPGYKTGFLYINVDAETIRGAFEKLMFSETGTCLLMDNTGQILSHPDREKIGTDAGTEKWGEAVLAENQCSGCFNVDGKDTMVSAVKSEYLNLYFVYQVDREMFYQPTKQVENSLGIVVGCFLLLSFSLAVLCAYVNAAPIRKLVKHLNPQGRIWDSSTDAVTDIERLEGAFSAIENQNELIRRNRPAVNNMIFYNLIMGREYFAEDSAELMRLAGVESDKGYFGVVLIRFDAERNRKIVFSLLSDFTTRDTYAQGTVILDEQTVCVIVNVDSQIAVRLTAEKISSILNEGGFPDALIGVGCLCDSLQKLQNSYEDARQAIKYRQLFPERKIFDKEELQGRTDRIPEEYMDTLRNFPGKGSEWMDGVRNFVSYVRKNGTVILYEEMRETVFGTISRAVLRKKEAEEYDQLTEALEELKETENLTQFTAICDLLKDLYGDEYSIPFQYTEKAKEFALNHLANQNLVEETARMLNISGAHFSRVFRATTGERFTDYISRIRIEEAKKLLRETDMLQQKIAQMTGFGDNISYFGKKFKESCGMTPGDYRKQFREDGKADNITGSC